MNIMQLLAENWDFILLILVAVAAVVYAVFRGNKSVVMKMLYALVTEAEKAFGGGTGSLKLATVIEKIYPKLPAIIKMFVTDQMLEKWVDEALLAAKTAWKKNTSLAEYVSDGKAE